MRAAVLRAAAGIRTPEVQAIVRAVVKRLAELVAAAAGAKPARR